MIFPCVEVLVFLITYARHHIRPEGDQELAELQCVRRSTGPAPAAQTCVN